MFDELSKKISDAMKTLKGDDKLTTENITPALRLVKRALIEADVNLQVATEFLEGVRNKAIGIEVVKGIKPIDKFVEVVYSELTEVMGEENVPLNEALDRASVFMLVGLQGAGKTTAAAKLAKYLKKEGKSVLLVAADTFRPAAKDQLKKLAEEIDVDVFEGDKGQDSIDIAKCGKEVGDTAGYNIVIIDTAGRQYIDNDSMIEAEKIKGYLNPDEVLLVVDSMIGQEAAELTKEFDKRIGITGAILTKLDGDSRGGAALTIKKVSGKPIKFIGTGEKIDALEKFYPERLASRILGMGDILTLVDKAQKEIEIKDVTEMQKKFENATFNFNDFLQQMKLIKRMGSIGGLIKLIPGMNNIDSAALKAGEKQLRKIEVIITSMTNDEKGKPELLIKSHSRRLRVANGSGHHLSEVDKVVNDFEKMRGMMKHIATGKMGPNFNNPVNKKQSNRNSKSENIFETNENRNEIRIGKIKKKKGFFDR